MKKIIILILMFCIGYANTVKAEDTDLTAIDNVIYLAPVLAETGTTINLSVCMKNSEAIRGFQFNLYLPDGVTVTRNPKNSIQASLSTERIDEDDRNLFTLSTSKQDDGSILLLCGSQEDATFTGNDGEVATISILVSENVALGEYPVILKNINVAETDIKKSHKTPYVESTLIVTKETGIEKMNNPESTNNKYYNLAGQQTEKAQKGINITNGRKVVVK